jgi:hypothetical protein
MKNAVPYYTLLALILLIIFAWFLFGGGNYQFVGIGPLYADNVITKYDEITVADTQVTQQKIPKTMIQENNIEEFVCLTEKEEKLDILHDVPIQYNEEKEIDLTPTLPDEFCGETRHVDGGKFVSKGEQICRETMEKIYGVPFINTRPKWLKNPTTNRNLELDCYNDKLKLAVEYNGIQHYKWCSFAKQSYSDFREQIRRDRIKVDLCEQHGVYLIVVPYNVTLSQIPTYIMYHLPEIVRKRLTSVMDTTTAVTV